MCRSGTDYGVGRTLFHRREIGQAVDLHHHRGKNRCPNPVGLWQSAGADALAFRICPTMQCMIAKELLEILVCPACKSELEYRQNPETLKCKACQRVYPVRDNIPIMLVDEAKIEA